MPFSRRSLSRRRLAWVLPATALGWGLAMYAPTADAQVWKGFLQLGDLRGESTDKTHTGWIEVSAFDEGVSNRVNAATGATASGAAGWKPLTVSHALDVTSPRLWLALAQAKSLGAAVLELWQTTGAKANFLKLELQDVRVSRIGTVGTTGGVPNESLSLTFGGMTANSVAIKVTKKGGSLAGRAGSEATNADASAPGFPWVPVVNGDEASSNAAADEAGWLSRNLLRNPGAEAGVGTPAAWAVTGDLFAQPYEALPGLGGVPPHGANFFTAGARADDAQASQRIDLTTAALAIDAGQLQAILAGWLGGTTGSADAARLVALFRDATGVSLGSLDLTSTSPEPTLVRLERAGLVPPGTRSIEVALEFKGPNSSDAGPRADDLSLVLEEQAAGSKDLPVEIQFVRANGAVERSQVRLSWVARTGGVIVESAPSVAGPWQRETIEPRQTAGREHLEVTPESDTAARFWRVRPAAELR